MGHVQKRMGNALRRYVKDMKGKKLSDNKSVSGKGRLTQLKIDRVQRNYGEAIRKNKGSLKEMQDAVWAIFHHTELSLPLWYPFKHSTGFVQKAKPLGVSLIRISQREI